MLKKRKINYLLVNKLKEKKLHISFAESCTGGLLAKLITDVPGASEILAESLITYSTESKMKYLGIEKITLDKYDIVSKEITKEMVLGLSQLTNADICVSVSGYAGPSGDVGKICFSIKYQNIIKDFEKKYRGNRSRIRSAVSKDILKEVYLIIS